MDFKNAQLKIKAFLSPKKKGQLRTPPIARPARDWKIVLLCMMIGILSSAVFAGYTYIASNAANSPSGDTSTVSSHSNIDQKEIKSILDVFDTRNVLHKQYTAAGPSLSDPSR